MTVQTTTSRADYTGNGVTTAFTVPFYFLDSTHIKVLRTQISTGAITTLALSTDYTVAGAGVSAGGTVTALVAPTTDQKISILRNVPQTQLIHYVPNDPFPAATHEQALDQLTMEVQQVNEVAGRALTLPANTASGSVSTSLPTPSANKLIGWNATSDGLQNIDQTTLATIVAFGTAKADVFSGTGSQTAFTLSANPGALNNLDVSISGVTQKPGIDYTWVSGTTLTFTSAPPAGTSNILARYLQGLPQGTTDSAASTYTPSGTGAVSTSVQTKLREFVSVKDFGAVGDGVTDDTTAMTAAHATGKLVFYPRGDYKFSTISFASGGIVGDGSGTRLLSTSTNTSDLITFTGVGTGSTTGDAVPYFANFYISVPTYSTKSAGAAIRLTPSQANPSNNVLFFPYFENIHIRNVPSGIVWDNTALVTVKDCKFFFYTGTAISSANTNAPDQGDNHIYGNTFYNGLGFNQGTALYIPSGGGLYFTNNKINGGLKGVHVKPLFTGSTSIFNIAANSLENISTGYGVHFEYGNASAGVQVSQVQITGNQFANNNYSVFFDNGAGTTFYWTTIAITGNTFLVNNSSHQPITLQSGRDFCITGNTFDKTGGVGGTAITIGALAAEGKILQNARYSFTSYVSNSSSSVFVQPDVLTGSGTTTATNTGYGTALFISPGNAVTFTRQFESAPTVQVGLQQGVGAGVSAYPGSVSATGFTIYGVTHTTAVAVTYNYVATGILRSY